MYAGARRRVSFGSACGSRNLGGGGHMKIPGLSELAKALMRLAQALELVADQQLTVMERIAKLEREQDE